MIEKNNTKKRQHRIIFLEIVIFMIIALLGARSIDLQIFKASSLTKKAEREYTRYSLIQGERGQIYDRNMNELSTSINTLSIAAVASKIKNPGIAASKLAAALGINEYNLKKKLSSNKSFVWVKRRVTPNKIKKVKALELEHIFFKNDTRRYYPNKSLAGQLIGFTGLDNKGLEGLEYKYNNTLSGQSIKIQTIKDATGRLVDSNKTFGNKFKGNSLMLSIDKKIQFIAEHALASAVVKEDAKSGTALVMVPSTGELLAIAHYPKFNPNHYAGFTPEIWRNRAVADQFEPGSVMKIFAVATALNQGVASPKSIFYCENGAYKIGKYTINDTRPHGWLTLTQIVKYSSNIGAIKISEAMSNKAFYKSLNDFGFAKKTKINCPGETFGELRHYSNWSNLDSSTIAFGQGIAVSAIQLITGVSAIANNGVLMKPLLVKQIISNTGEITKINGPTPTRRVISDSAARKVKMMMQEVVSEKGTGNNAFVKGYSVGGKTGTAQIANRNSRGYSEDKFTAVFAGFAPIQNPELAILVVVDEPKNSHYGGIVAAPVFKNILLESFNYLGIPPDFNNSQMVAEVSAKRKQ
ncbi:MAG: penicillin-binding protein 2 [Desulfobacteraceae bacterium]|nr:penicillin-binding protein 2 [Desulfobacteraceae bacterium]